MINLLRTLPTIGAYDNGRTLVARDDLLPGGTKRRFLPILCEGYREIVFGAPFCGGAPVALAHYGKDKGRVVDLDSETAYPEFNIHSIIARGYWEEPGDIDEDIRKQIEALLK